MDTMDEENEERGIEDLLVPRRRTMTDIWREEEERHFKRNAVRDRD